jgi:acetylornithine aminotransferase
VVPAPPGYLQAARATCDAHGALLVLDEVQSGIGRSGNWFGHEQEGITPDVITLAKGLGGGLPLGACIGVGAAGRRLRPGDHGSTFGGNPVACAAALAVIDTIVDEHLLANVATVGAAIETGVCALVGAVPLLTGIRGRGLWHALTLSEPASAQVEEAARDAGFLVNAVAPDAIRLAPPLLLSEPEATRFLATLPAVLTAAASVLAELEPGGPG